MQRSIYTDGRYLDRHPGWHAEDARDKAALVADILRRNQLTPASIADIGCGSGDVLVELGRQFRDARLTGFDISPQAISLCADKQDARTSFILADGSRSELCRADLLLCLDVIEHVDDYVGLIGNLKQKATFKIFHIPLDLSVQTVWRMEPILRVRQEYGHIHYFSKETAFAALADAGYQIVDWQYTRIHEQRPMPLAKTRALVQIKSLLRRINEDLEVRLLGGASMLILAR